MSNSLYYQLNKSDKQWEAHLKQLSGYNDNNSKILTIDSSNTNLTGNLNTKHIIPITANTYDLGSIDKPYRDLFISENTIHMGEDIILTVDDSQKTFKVKKFKNNWDVELQNRYNNINNFNNISKTDKKQLIKDLKSNNIKISDVENIFEDDKIRASNFELNNPSNNYIFTLAPHTNMTSNYTLTFPASNGTSGQILQLNNSGILEWSSINSTDALPVQIGNSGKLLITDGSNATWSNDISVNNIDVSGNILANGRIDFFQNNNSIVYYDPSGILTRLDNLDNNLLTKLNIANSHDISNVTAGTVRASSAVVVDANKDITGYRNVNASAFYGDGSNLTGINAGGTELINNNLTLRSFNAYASPGNYSIALGQNAQNNSTQQHCVSIGYLANQGCGSNSIGIGYLAGHNSSGSNRVAIGYQPHGHGAASNSIGIGFQAGGHVAGQGSITIGYLASQWVAGDYSIAIGYKAGDQDSNLGGDRVGTHNNSIVLNATGLKLNATQPGFVVAPVREATNSKALYYDTTSKEITYYDTVTNLDGLSDCKVAATSSYFIGGGGGNCTGAMNTSFGYEAGNVIANQINNTYIGGASGRYNNTANRNCAIGRETLRSSSGNENTAIGTSASTLISGHSNTSLGYAALYQGTGNSNTSIGWQSLFNTTSGSFNIAIGYKSSHGGTSGNNNITIGNESELSNTNTTNAIAIGYQVLADSNEVRIGNNSVTDTYLKGNLHINNKIAINGNYGNANQVLVSNGSGGGVSWANQTDTNTTYSAGVGLTLNGTTFNNVYSSFYPGTKLYNSPWVGQFGVARVDFTNGAALAFHGSSYGGSSNNYLDIMFTHGGVQFGATNGTTWAGSQILVLNQPGAHWEIYDFGTGSATRLVPYSDDRIKTHEQTFSGQTYINWVKQMIPKKYKKYGVILTKQEEELLETGGDPFEDRRTGDPIKDSSFDPQIEYGVIAQDIHKISGLEDIVKIGKNDGKWSVDYRSIDTITLGAVKELIDKIEKLEARIKVLEGN